VGYLDMDCPECGMVRVIEGSWVRCPECRILWSVDDLEEKDQSVTSEATRGLSKVANANSE